MAKELDPDAEQIMVMKAVTAQTGVLHEGQVLQLKYLPLILTHASKATCTVDIEKKKVIFNLTETSGSKPKDFNKRLVLLSQYTKNLLGDNFGIQILLKNKEVYSKDY